MQLCHEARTSQGFVVLEAEEGARTRTMNARTVDTGHRSLSVLPTKTSTPTLKGSVWKP